MAKPLSPYSGRGPRGGLETLRRPRTRAGPIVGITPALHSSPALLLRRTWPFGRPRVQRRAHGRNPRPPRPPRSPLTVPQVPARMAVGDRTRETDVTQWSSELRVESKVLSFAQGGGSPTVKAPTISISRKPGSPGAPGRRCEAEPDPPNDAVGLQPIHDPLT